MTFLTVVALRVERQAHNPIRYSVPAVDPCTNKPHHISSTAVQTLLLLLLLLLLYQSSGLQPRHWLVPKL